MGNYDWTSSPSAHPLFTFTHTGFCWQPISVRAHEQMMTLGLIVWGCSTKDNLFAFARADNLPLWVWCERQKTVCFFNTNNLIICLLQLVGEEEKRICSHTRRTSLDLDWIGFGVLEFLWVYATTIVVCEVEKHFRLWSARGRDIYLSN